MRMPNMSFASATSSVRDIPLEIVDDMLFCAVLFPLVLSKVVISSYLKRAWSKHPRHCIMRATATESDNLVDEELLFYKNFSAYLMYIEGRLPKNWTLLRAQQYQSMFLWDSHLLLVAKFKNWNYKLPIGTKYHKIHMKNVAHEHPVITAKVWNTTCFVVTSSNTFSISPKLT